MAIANALAATLASILLMVSCIGCSPTPSPSQKTAATPVQPVGDPIEGLRVATRVGCNGCHGKDAGGDVFIEIPKTVRLVAPNLTQRRESYDDKQLAALLRTGRTLDGHRPLGMPIVMFQHLSDREVRDIIAWMRAAPAVDNRKLPESWYGDEMKQQLADGTYPYDDDKADPGNQPPAVPPEDIVALGRHLAMTSCVECHGRDLTGWGPDDATPSLVLVSKAYTPEKFARLMKTGMTASGKPSKTGMMTGVAKWRFATLSEHEVQAIKQYLDTR